MAVTGADVTIRYAFLPTESSIRESSEKILKGFNKNALKGRTGMGIYSEAFHRQINSGMKAASGKITSEYKKTTDSVINLLRATQQKTSLQTKILSGMKFIEGKGITGGAGGEGAAAGAGGGVMGALGTIAALLVVIAVAMTLISAFFDAVGPIIKVVMKMFSAMILILLAPFLKRGLPILFGILKWMIVAAKGISGFADKLLTNIENIFGRVVGGDPLAIFELILGPMGTLGGFLLTKLVEFLAGIDWDSIIKPIIPLLESAFKVVSDAINSFGIAVFGEETWKSIKEAIAFIKIALSPTGLWEKIMGVIKFIGEKVFGEDLWEKIKASIVEVNTLIETEWATIIATLKDVGNALKPLAAMFQSFKPSPARRRAGGPFTGVLPFGLDILANQFVQGGVANDFISRGGKIQKFSSDDTIIGTKNPGGVNITNNLHVSAGVDKSAFKKILSEFSRMQARDLRTRTSYYGR